MTGSARIVRGNALALPLDDSTVDLVVTSPPYFGLRSYQDGGEHYDGQIGDEATPAEFVDALLAATREMARVLKPSGSIWVNLGDKYASIGGHGGIGTTSQRQGRSNVEQISRAERNLTGVPTKSLIGVPWRYALRCIDDLGLILRAEVIWSKPNGLPESVTDRVRRSHETWFHFTKAPRYFSAVDEVREEHVDGTRGMTWEQRKAFGSFTDLPAIYARSSDVVGRDNAKVGHVLGKLPGSVWTIPTQPLRVPEHLGVDHFAAFPMEWPRRIIRGWSPSGVCEACGEGRRPTTTTTTYLLPGSTGDTVTRTGQTDHRVGARKSNTHTVTGYACACPEPTAPTRPAVVLDPFGGTGTTALVAKVLGRHAVSVDMSADYCRLATWRTTDPDQIARAMQVDKPARQVAGQADLFDHLEAAP